MGRFLQAMPPAEYARGWETTTKMSRETIMSIHIRFAGPSDREELRAMQAQSFRELGAAFYDEEIIACFISRIGTMDDALLEDGTYLAVVMDGRIVGSGGWSWRVPGYARHEKADAARPSVTRATVRSVFVHPRFGRRGIGSALMAAIESEVVAAGYDSASLTATFSGIPLYRRMGYRSGAPVAIELPNGRTFAGLAMTKRLARLDRVAAAA
jgi:GNAT superfamily N-acetyltransferase